MSLKQTPLREYRKLAKASHWVHRKRFPLSQTEKYWLRGNQSLTKQLTQKSNDQLEVIVLNEVLARPFPHEARKLGVSLNRVAKIREVELRCKDQAAVYARSVIPLKVLKGSGLQLLNLGNTPLGHILFKRAKVDLETREITYLKYSENEYWARRTLYCFNQQNILVSEFFLFEL